MNSKTKRAVIEAALIAPLVNLLQNAEFDIKKEAAWAISNATSGGTHDQIKYLVGQGCIKPLCDLLVCPDPRIVTVCLEGLENILKVGEAEKSLGNTGDVNLYAQMIDDAEGLEKIENLQSHDNNEIYEKAVKILLHPSPSVLIPALRTVGNIVTGDDMQTQSIINHGALPCLLNLLTHNHKKSIKKEACWTISNITAGNKEQIQVWLCFWDFGL
ncbi:importin subunit alpha-4 [Cajanus cajan]|uniref:importin subunit alpha-4 n=1 Tax=Cajanus cajan TaxID=3821 RepID=UPI00098DAE69|nr:importin subunit alpha-4 [Cajanus cajan]